MAEIFLVADQIGHRFILRVLQAQYRSSWSHNRHFHWGCEVERHLDHPNVVRLFEEGKFQDRRYCILGYVDGTNLKERIIRSDPQLALNRSRLLLGMARGLSHVHTRGYIHLDFKPENIVVSRAYDPVIVDFDLAIPLPSHPKKVSKLSGTPVYLAPEQILRQPVDERADIFAFGLTAYEMLTGKKPITGNTIEEVIRKYAEFDQHLKPPRTHVPELPANIERVILKCLEKDTRRRYPSMSLVVRDLQK